MPSASDSHPERPIPNRDPSRQSRPNHQSREPATQDGPDPASVPLGEPAPILAARDVAVTVDGTTLLPSTTLEVAAGECVAVLGPNGAGKTTLLRVLAGRLRPTAGAATLRGAALDERRVATRREIAALIEPPSLYPDLTLREQLALIEAAWADSSERGRARTRGRARDRGRDRARDRYGTRDRDRAAAAIPGLGSEALERFGLATLRDRFPHELSSGQRQLLSLAVAFARPADVLLLDEPEQRLDPERRGIVAEAIEEARRRGAAVVFSSHDPGLVDRVAGRPLRVGA